MKELHARQHVEQAERLAELRHAVARIRGEGRELLGEARTGCGVARRALPGRLRAYRESEKARLRRELKEARQAARNRCDAAKARARAKAGSAVEAARLALAEERKTARIIRAAEGKIRKASAFRSTAAERREESDDEVRGNIPPGLVPVFERVKRAIHGTGRRTRTEAFEEWAAENADQVAAMKAELAEREFGRLLREHQAEERAAQAQRSRRRTRPTAAELAEVPF